MRSILTLRTDSVAGPCRHGRGLSTAAKLGPVPQQATAYVTGLAVLCTTASHPCLPQHEHSLRVCAGSRRVARLALLRLEGKPAPMEAPTGQFGCCGRVWDTPEAGAIARPTCCCCCRRDQILLPAVPTLATAPRRPPHQGPGQGTRQGQGWEGRCLPMSWKPMLSADRLLATELGAICTDPLGSLLH